MTEEHFQDAAKWNGSEISCYADWETRLSDQTAMGLLFLPKMNSLLADHSMEFW
jgi:hypothetical protein